MPANYRQTADSESYFQEHPAPNPTAMPSTRNRRRQRQPENPAAGENPATPATGVNLSQPLQATATAVPQEPALPDRSVGTVAASVTPLDLAPARQPERYTLTNVTVERQIMQLYGNGSNYNDAQWPELVGSLNWATWDRKLKNAARSEKVLPLLNGVLTKPIEPPANCNNNTWNEYVETHHRYYHANNNLLSGILKHLSHFLQGKVEDIEDAKAVYEALKKESQHRGANIVGEEVEGLILDNLSQHRTVQEFAESFSQRIQRIQQMELPWTMPEELLQIWFLTNLGDSYSSFRSMLYQNFKIAGVGQGAAVTLSELMTRAQNQEALMASETRHAAPGTATYAAFTPRNSRQGGKRPGGNTFSNQLGPAKRLERKVPWDFSKKRTTIPAGTPSNERKICSIHGWFPGASNHDDSTCRKAASAYILEYTQTATPERSGTSAAPENRPTVIDNSENFVLSWPEGIPEF